MSKTPENALKDELKGANGSKIWTFKKIKVRVHFLVHLVMHKRVQTEKTINAFEMSLMIQLRVT